MTGALSEMITVTETGALCAVKRPIPVPGRGEVLVRVKGFGVNRADLLQRAGHYPPPPDAPQDVLGLEFAGEVLFDVGRWRAGDRVMGICSGGGYSAHLCANEGCLLPVPDAWSWAQASTFSEVFLTAYDALRQVQLSAGERLLVHAIGSGVGGAVAQLGAWMGATVTGTTRSVWKRDRALDELPVRHVVQLSEGDFTPLTSLGGFDVIVDFVGAAYLPQNVKALRDQGRLIIVGLLGGVKAELPLGLLLARRLSLRGTVLRSRTLAEKCSLNAEVERKVLPALRAGLLTPPAVDKIFEATPEGIEEAHGRLRRAEAWSKLACLW